MGSATGTASGATFARARFLELLTGVVEAERERFLRELKVLVCVADDVVDTIGTEGGPLLEVEDEGAAVTEGVVLIAIAVRG